MKKISALLLTVALLLGCWGCALVKDKKADEKNAASASGKETPAPAPETTCPEGTLPVQLPEETICQTTPPEFSIGSVTENTYKNDFLDIRCTVPAGWEYYNEQQILELNHIVGRVPDAETAQLLAKADHVIAMYVSEPASGSSIQVSMEKNTSLLPAETDLKQTLEGQIDYFTTVYENMGFFDVSVVYEKIWASGREYDALIISGKMADGDFRGATILFAKGSYMVSLGICANPASAFEEILGYVSVD